jgi:hypothetical protein
MQRLGGSAGACNHAIGRLALAYADYDAAFGATVSPAAAQETLNFRATAYYQGEICIYLQRKLDADVLHFSIDRDLDEEFKEMWAKQQMPTQKLLHRCPKQVKRGHKFPADRKDVPMLPDEGVASLVTVADGVGSLLQYTHQGDHQQKENTQLIVLRPDVCPELPRFACGCLLIGCPAAIGAPWRMFAPGSAAPCACVQPSV